MEEKKFTVDAVVIGKAFKHLLQVVERGPVVPDLEYFTMSIKDNLLEIEVSDILLTEVRRVTVSGGVDGIIRLHQSDIRAVLKLFKKGEITFTSNDTHTTVSVGKKAIKVKDGSEGYAQEFNLVESRATKCTSTGEKWYGVFSKLSTYVSDDELRPAMMGIYYDADNKHLVATNGHIMGYVPVEDILGKSVILSSIPKLVKLFKTVKGTITITNYWNYVKFEYSDGYSLVKCIDEEYPAWLNVVPTDSTITTKVSIDQVEDITNTVNEALMFCNKTNHKIDFDVFDSDIVITSEDIDEDKEFTNVVKEFTNVVKAQTNSTNEREEGRAHIYIAFNGKYFLTIMKNHKQGATLTMSTYNRAVVIKSDGISSLIMPVLRNF